MTPKGYFLIIEAALSFPFGLKKEIWLPTPQSEKPEGTAKGGHSGTKKYDHEEAVKTRYFFCVL